MTTINDINDLARILREKPEWVSTLRNLLLSQELLDLPEKFAQFVQTTNDNFQLVNRRLERLEEDVGVLKDDVAVLKDDVGVLKEDVSVLKEDMGLVKQDLNQVKENLNRVNGKMDNALGANYEFKIQRNIGSIAGQYLNLRRVRVQQGPRTDRDPRLEELLEQAEDQQLITKEQYLDLQRLDLVFTGRQQDRTGETTVAAEISITIGNNDIERAARRAQALNQALNQEVIPVVIGAHIDEERRQMAQEQAVSIMLEPDTE